MIYFFEPTGFVTLQNQSNYSQSINEIFLQDQTYLINIEDVNFLKLNSITLDGYIEGRGTAKIYAVFENKKYLLMDSEQINQDSIITGLAIDEITGEENSEEQQITDTEITNDIVQETQEITNEEQEVSTQDINPTETITSSENQDSIIISNDTLEQNETISINDLQIELNESIQSNQTNIEDNQSINETTSINENINDQEYLIANETNNSYKISFKSICIETCDINLDYSNFSLEIHVNGTQLYLKNIDLIGMLNIEDDLLEITETLNTEEDEKEIITNLPDGKKNVIIPTHSTIQHEYKNKFYDLNSLVDMKFKKSNMIISYDQDKDTIFTPYLVINGNKIEYSKLKKTLKSDIKLAKGIKEGVNKNKFAWSFYNNIGITEIGFDISGSTNREVIGTKLYIDGLLQVDFQDIEDSGYSINLNKDKLSITNLNQGYNFLDPIVEYNLSTSKSGHIYGAVEGSGNGTQALTAVIRAGYNDIGNVEYRGFMSFNTASIPDDSTITGATFSFYVSSYSNYDTGEDSLPCHVGDWTINFKGAKNLIGSSLDITDYSRSATLFRAENLNSVGRYSLELNNTNLIDATGETDIILKSNFTNSGGCVEFLDITLTSSGAQKPYLNITYTEGGSDTTLPQFISGSIQKNQTTVYQNTLINFTANWTDETQLGSWIFSLNQTGTYVNSTSIAFAAGLNISSNISMITAIPGTNVTWRFWANDSSNNWNVTSIQSFVVSDNVNPQWISGSVQKNQTTVYQNTLINFSANWTDNVALDKFIIEINQSGSWYNSSLNSFTATTNISSNITMITAIPGTNVSWRFWANDSSNNWNVTSIQSFVVSDNVNPQWISGSVQKNQTTVYQNTLINFTANWTDNIALDKFIIEINQSGSWYNSSLNSFTTTTNISSNVTMITALAGTNVSWRFWANDSSNNWNVTSIQSFVVADNNNPQWVANSLIRNQTTIYQNTLINFSANWTDNVDLDSWIFSLNQTGVYVNSTSIAFAAGLNISSNISMISAAIGTNVTYRFWVNDSNNNWNVTYYDSFVIADNNNPQWVANSLIRNQTTIYQNTLINFSANWTDNVDLDSWIFSLNQTGVYVNSTSIAFAAGLNISSNVSAIISVNGTNVTYRFWVNDSNNNWNVTYYDSFVIATNTSNATTSTTPLGIINRDVPDTYSEIITYDNLNPGQAAEINSEKIGIYKVIIPILSRVENAKFKLSKLENLPSNIMPSNLDIIGVYSLTKEGIYDSQIGLMRIEYSLEKKSLAEKNIDYQKIRLYAYQDNSWNELEGSIISEDDKIINYQARSLSSSYYIIANMKSNSLTNTTNSTIVKSPERYSLYNNNINLKPYILMFLWASLIVVIVSSRFTKKKKSKR